MLHVEELTRRVIERELLAACCASVGADELPEERGSDQHFSHGGLERTDVQKPPALPLGLVGDGVRRDQA